MTDAYIYDAVRTPRGKGRKDGALHEVTPVRLAVASLQALRDRNKLDTHLVDDVTHYAAGRPKLAILTAGMREPRLP